LHSACSQRESGYFFGVKKNIIHSSLLATSVLSLAGGLTARAASHDLLPIKDARVLGFFPDYQDVNFKADILSAYTAVGNVQRTFMQFDLSGVVLEPGQRLASATLKLVAYTGFGGSNGKPMEIYAVTRPWTEDGLTWNRADVATLWSEPGGDYAGVGGDLNGSPYAVSTATPADGAPVTWDLRELVDQWLEGALPNYGLLLKSVEGNALTFNSRESTSSASRPMLLITTEPGPPRLRVEREVATGKVLISWRGVGTAILQERAALGSGSNWSDSALAVTSSSGRSVVTLTPGSGPRLFRLRSIN
jgi:hypothetical protein